MVDSEGREVYCILFINLNFIKLLVDKYIVLGTFFFRNGSLKDIRLKMHNVSNSLLDKPVIVNCYYQNQSIH